MIFAVVLLILVLLASLFVIPLGLPGIWVMVAAAVLYSFLMPNTIGWGTIVAVGLVGLVAEILEFTLGGRYARKYGGSRRAGWWAIFGGLIGAFVGVPVPVIGSVIGAFVGAFLGALAAEFSVGSSAEASTRVAVGAVIGKAIASALKVAMGLVIAVWIVGAVLV